jgi:hypothetical protein
MRVKGECWVGAIGAPRRNAWCEVTKIAKALSNKKGDSRRAQAGFAGLAALASGSSSRVLPTRAAAPRFCDLK